MNKFFFILVFFVVSSCGKDEPTPNDPNPSNTLKDIESLTTYESEIKTGVSLMFFHATWCSICKAQRPDIELLTKNDELKAVKFGQVDTDKNKEITSKFNVPGQPVILIYKDGKEEKRLSGSGHSQQKLADILKGLL